MKYSFMSFSCPQLALGDMLGLAKRLGYEGVEPRAASGHAHGVEIEADAGKRREIRRTAEASGIVLSCIATSCRFSDPAGAGEQAELALRYVKLAHDVGANRIRVFGGQIPQGVTRKDAVAAAVQALAAVARPAREAGVTVCVETHDDWCDPAEILKIVSGVNDPAVRINWDIMHPAVTAGRTVEEAWRALAPWVRHVHFHDGVRTGGRMELRPIGQGSVDHLGAVRLLKAAGYDGFLSGEWIAWEPYDVHLPRELAAMRALEEKARS